MTSARATCFVVNTWHLSAVCQTLHLSSGSITNDVLEYNPSRNNRMSDKVKLNAVCGSQSLLTKEVSGCCCLAVVVT